MKVAIVGRKMAQELLCGTLDVLEVHINGRYTLVNQPVDGVWGTRDNTGDHNGSKLHFWSVLNKKRTVRKELTICASRMEYTLRMKAFRISGELSETLTPYCE